MARAFLTLITAAVILTLVLLLVRELWRGLSPSLRRALDRRAREAAIADRTEETLRAPGATPDNPVEVTSASVVEARAASETCVVCGERIHVEAHAVERIGGRLLRVVHLACRRCGHRRPFYIHIAEPEVLH